ncbi:hypothetical protein D3C76_1032450 [compost metagenome]
MQLREEVLLLALHQPGALLQFAQDARQAVAGRFVEHLQALPQAVLESETTLHAARDVALHAIDQVDDLMLLCAGILEFVTNDVLAEQPGRSLWRATVKVSDHPVQVANEFRVLALAVGVPEGVVHGIGRDVMANHQGHGLLEQGRRLAGVFRIQR